MVINVKNEKFQTVTIKEWDSLNEFQREIILVPNEKGNNNCYLVRKIEKEV